MNYMDLDKDFAIGTSPTPDDLNRLKASGFKSIVDLRVSGEVGAPSISDEQEVARSLELTLLHIAVPARTLPGELLDLFRREVPSLPKRIFVHCTKGGRAALFTGIHLGLEVGASEDDIVARVRGVDFFDEPDKYDAPIRTYIKLAREPLSHLEEVIW